VGAIKSGVQAARRSLTVGLPTWSGSARASARAPWLRERL